ncbi:MAG: hypothetical protein CM1200mP23_0490 [Nitrososphaerota archaeon]|nr:MAG: hypothetical protein CM1200mP23_0490 [Nitrososphaerota archaeon]
MNITKKTLAGGAGNLSLNLEMKKFAKIDKGDVHDVSGPRCYKKHLKN